MIVNAKQEDINSINQLGKTLYPNFEKIFKLDDYVYNKNYIILLNKEENINAFMIMYKNIDCYELETIIVSEYARNNGIATSLIKHFIKNYTINGDQIFLEVSCKNEQALKLYKKFDFNIINIRKKYYGDSDAYVMKKVIK